MKLLALDTSSLACSVALQVDDGLAWRHEEQAREHTRILVPMIEDVLAEAGLKTADLDGIVLGNGPGSFIGMRIGTAVAQGLAHGAGLGVVPVSSLLAVAAQVIAEEGARAVAVCQDAHMNEVYLGLYAAGRGGVPKLVGAERIHDLSVIAEMELEPGRFTAAGFGWQRYPALLAANEDRIGNTSDVLYPHARFLLPLGRAVLEGGDAIAPQDIAPAYLRSKVAERPA